MTCDYVTVATVKPAPGCAKSLGAGDCATVVTVEPAPAESNRELAVRADTNPGRHDDFRSGKRPDDSRDSRTVTLGAAWSSRRRVYHDPGCRWAREIAEANWRSGLATAAVATGRRPCRVCSREDYP